MVNVMFQILFFFGMSSNVPAFKIRAFEFWIGVNEY